MAQLKDTVVSGNLRITDTTLTDTLQTTVIKAPTTAGGTTYGPGTSGQVLKTNGTSVYWDSDNNTYVAGNHLSLSGNTFSVAATAKTITDWNSATTTGWYMGSSATNAPSTAWWIGRVTAHNTNYVIQEVWQFTKSSDVRAVPHYKRMKTNGTWGSWYDLTVGKAVPTDAVFTDTTYSAGTGLSLSDTTFNHTDSITEQSTAVFKKIKYNSTGHITGVDDVTASDLPAHTHSYLPLSGGTMTGSIFYVGDGGRKLEFGGGTYKYHVATTSAWAGGLTYYDADGAQLGEFGAYGAANSLSYFYMGGTYNAPQIKIEPTGPNLTINSSAGSTPTLTFFRNGNNKADWRIRNDSGVLKFQSDYTTTVGSWYDALTIAYNTGNVSMKSGATFTFGSFGAAADNVARHVFFRHSSSNQIVVDDDFKYNPSTNVLTVGSISGSAAKWTTGRTITIGSTSKTLDGSSDVSWSLSEIGAAPAVSGGYLPLSGGTITKSSFGPLTIERTGGTQAAAIYFKNTNGVLGAIGMTGNVDSGLYRWTANTSSSYRILDAENYTSYTYGATTSRMANTVLAAPDGSNGVATFRALVADDLPSHSHSDYVLKVGDTMSGGLTISQSTDGTFLTTTRSDTSVTVKFGVGSDGTSHGIYSSKQSSWLFYGDASNVYIKTTAISSSTPSTESWNIPLLGSSSNSVKQLITSTAFRYKDEVLAASAGTGHAIFIIGNGSNTGASGNRQGSVRLYSESTSYIDFVPASTSSAKTITLPAITGKAGVVTGTITSGQIVITDGANGGIKSSGYTISTSVPVNALFTDEKVKATTLAASTADASYYPTLVTAAGTAGVSIFDSIKFTHAKGTTSANGNQILILGNSTTSGKANNEFGAICLYSTGQYHATIKTNGSFSSNKTLLLPDEAGTIATREYIDALVGDINSILTALL